MFNIFRAIRRARTTTPATIDTLSDSIVDTRRKEIADRPNHNNYHDCLYYPYINIKLTYITYNTEYAEWTATATTGPAFEMPKIYACGQTKDAAEQAICKKIEKMINSCHLNFMLPHKKHAIVLTPNTDKPHTNTPIRIPMDVFHDIETLIYPNNKQQRVPNNVVWTTAELRKYETGLYAFVSDQSFIKALYVQKLIILLKYIGKGTITANIVRE